jgi:DNA-binding winged helix-turn-helix (wHTH) protein/tetratricopeptide (TPR) repeat protein
MPNPGRSPDEASPNGTTTGTTTGPEAREVARFLRPAEPLRGFAFGGFILDLARGALLQDGIEIRLRAKSLDVLAYLVRHPGRLIAKRELIEAIWPDVAVTDDSLVQCLVEIRRALGDQQAWVHTARGRGYRFDGDVRPVLGAGAGEPSGASTATTDVGGVSGVVSSPGRAPGEPGHAPSEAERLAGRPRVLSRGLVLTIGLVAIAALSAAGWAVWGRGSSPVPRTAEAARAYAEGERSEDRRNRESIGRAIEAYERAIALDPAFAPAQAGLANTLVIRGVFGGARPDESYPKARAAALRAVTLDPMLADGHIALGHVRVQWDRDWRGAEDSYRRALALDPNAWRAHMLYAYCLNAMGRFDEGLLESRTALTLKPESATVSASRVVILFMSRRPEEAIEQGRLAIRLDPGFSLGHFWQALALADVGRFDEAMTEALASRTGVGNLPVAVVGYIHGRAGRRAEALEVLRALEAARARSIYVPATDLALVAAGMGDRETALSWLEQAFDEHAHWMETLRIFPPFDPLRDEPRFKTLVDKMKFP